MTHIQVYQFLYLIAAVRSEQLYHFTCHPFSLQLINLSRICLSNLFLYNKLDLILSPVLLLTNVLNKFSDVL